MAATSIVISGLTKLKNANGAYVNTETPKTVDCVIPHVFHGTSADVTVTESSVVLLKRRDS